VSWELRLHLSRSAPGTKKWDLGLSDLQSGDCIYPKSAYSCVITSLAHTHTCMHLSRGTPALFIPGFQRAQWHKKAGVGAGRDSPNGTVIMTLEQPKKKPELLISLVCVCARRAAQGWPSYHLLSQQPDQLRCVNKCTPGYNGTPYAYVYISVHYITLDMHTYACTLSVKLLMFSSRAAGG
jgi:hypothetical protein